jgi:hypothetical protein
MSDIIQFPKTSRKNHPEPDTGATFRAMLKQLFTLDELHEILRRIDQVLEAQATAEG